MNKTRLISLFTAALALTLSLAQAQPTLIAIGSLTQSRAGANADLSDLTYNLENGTPANLLGGLDSAIAYDSGKKFLLLPDRGPNAVTFDDAIDSTVSLRRSRGLRSVPDVRVDHHTRLHTLWISNDNDFLLQTADVPPVPNPNQFFVFGFTDDDLPGYVPPSHGLAFGD